MENKKCSKPPTQQCCLWWFGFLASSSPILSLFEHTYRFVKTKQQISWLLISFPIVNPILVAIVQLLETSPPGNRRWDMENRSNRWPLSVAYADQRRMRRSIPSTPQFLIAGGVLIFIYIYIHIYIYIYFTLWLFNIAMENGPFIDDLWWFTVPIKTGDFPWLR